MSGTEPKCNFRSEGLSVRLMLIAKGRSRVIARKVLIEATKTGITTENEILLNILY